MIPIQMLAYKLAVRKGINPDKPKNLAKVVTVE
jgi:glucosamine--fructose-6-phosphate aminotransferase (isomerizing)